METSTPGGLTAIGRWVPIAVLLLFVILPFVLFFGAFGVGLAASVQDRPWMDSALKMFFGLFAFVLGLQGLFRLAAYGPKSSRQDRVKEAVLSTGHLLVGVAVLAASTALSLPFGLGALACLLAVTLRRPRRVFAAS